MYYYSVEQYLAASLLPNLPFPTAPAAQPTLFLLDRGSCGSRVAFRVTDPKQLFAPENISWLDNSRLASCAPVLPSEISDAINAGTLTAVNINHPQWRESLRFLVPSPAKKRVHLLAVGDVGSTLLTALKLLGGDCISTIGICDLNEKTTARWCTEMEQISWPWDYDTLPSVETVLPKQLFDCDVFIFAATKTIPPVGSGIRDVRMAQFEANRPLVETFARQARDARYRGLFMVLSDPVDPLCKAAWLASNQDKHGNPDELGLLPEQIQGFGLGVMNARAAYFAKKDPRFASFLPEGRSFGPHGKGLVIANSIENYDDMLSRELTELVETANLQIRELGFKPYVAPAVSSGAMQLLLTLQGKWHCSSVSLGGVWFGVRNRYTPYGVETESLALPDALFSRLQDSEASLAAIL